MFKNNNVQDLWNLNFFKPHRINFNYTMLFLKSLYTPVLLCVPVFGIKWLQISKFNLIHVSIQNPFHNNWLCHIFYYVGMRFNIHYFPYYKCLPTIILIVFVFYNYDNMLIIIYIDRYVICTLYMYRTYACNYVAPISLYSLHTIFIPKSNKLNYFCLNWTLAYLSKSIPCVCITIFCLITPI